MKALNLNLENFDIHGRCVFPCPSFGGYSWIGHKPKLMEKGSAKMAYECDSEKIEEGEDNGNKGEL